MTVERILITAIRYTDPQGNTAHHIPLRDPTDNTWWTLDEGGSGVWQDAADVRRFADEWEAEGLPTDCSETLAAYRALADLIEKLDAR